MDSCDDAARRQDLHYWEASVTLRDNHLFDLRVSTPSLVKFVTLCKPTETFCVVCVQTFSRYNQQHLTFPLCIAVVMHIQRRMTLHLECNLLKALA
jgi:hypothetical protein